MSTDSKLDRKIEMIVYQPHQPIDDTELNDLGDPVVLGGKVLEGHPRISARVDLDQEGLSAGVFQATTGTLEVTFPFTEHATILDGEVTITDSDGNRHTYRPGDSYVIEQGHVVTWDVRGERVLKSFLNITR
ncbi:cupin domain-containing protein [Streptomyces chryseus]